MEFRRIDNLPPYVFAEVNQRKIAARRAGADVVDLGFGNPDIPSAPFVVEKLVEAARLEKNHRYSVSRGLPNLRKAVADRYQRRFGVTLDPDTEVISTIGSKEGLSHLMWTLVQPGDAAIVPLIRVRLRQDCLLRFSSAGHRRHCQRLLWCLWY